MTTIVVARDYSECPTARFREDGPASGAAFRDDVLAPALRGGEGVTVVFDGVTGFSAAFLDEAFGGLVRECGMDKAFLDEHLHISAEDPYLGNHVRLAKRYLSEARPERNADGTPSTPPPDEARDHFEFPSPSRWLVAWLVVRDAWDRVLESARRVLRVA